MYFSVVETRNSKIECQQIECLALAYLLVHKIIGISKQAPLGVFYNGTNTIPEGSALIPNHTSEGLTS